MSQSKTLEVLQFRFLLTPFFESKKWIGIEDSCFHTMSSLQLNHSIFKLLITAQTYSTLNKVVITAN